MDDQYLKDSAAEVGNKIIAKYGKEVAALAGVIAEAMILAKEADMHSPSLGERMHKHNVRVVSLLTRYDLSLMVLVMKAADELIGSAKKVSDDIDKAKEQTDSVLAHTSHL